MGAHVSLPSRLLRLDARDRRDGAGKVIVFQYEIWPGTSGPPDGELADIRLVNVALHEGVKRYAWLTALLPVRPRDAQSCSMCEGAGTFPAESVAALAELTCYCGGAGWVPATDTWVNKRRFEEAAKEWPAGRTTGAY